MLQLLQNYTVEEILIFVVILACAVRGAVTFFEWAIGKLRAAFGKEYNRDNEKRNIRKEIDEIKDMQVQQNENIKKLTASVDLLIKSDKDDIKAWITEKHHYFCYEVGAIDDYSLDCIEKRFEHYVDEGGNSFIADLMSDLRSLPKVSTSIQRDKIK